MLTFEYEGIVFQVSDAVENYAVKLNDNRRAKDGIGKMFTETYRGYKNMDTAVKCMRKDLLTLVKSLIEVYCEGWIDQGILDLDADFFAKNYFYPACGEDGMEVINACERIQDAYNEIVMTREQKEAYRRMRREARGRWVGGGFGLGGAVKGAATAGAPNVASGVGHGIFNAIGNIGSGIAESGQKRSLYESPATLQTLLSALYTDIFRVFQADNAFEEEHFGTEFKPRYTSETERAQTILKNIRNRKLGDEDFKNVIRQVFEIDPYNGELYRQCLLRFGDRGQKLQAMADFFGCGQELEVCKDQIMQKLNTTAEHESLEGYAKLLEELKPKIEYYGISPEDSPVLGAVQAKYDSLEQAARTFENVCYGSIGEAKTAKREKEELEEIMGSISFADKNSIKEGILRLEDHQTELYPKDAYLEKAEKALKEQILQSVNPGDKASLLECREELGSAGFRKIQVGKELDDLEDKIQHFDVYYRTVDGVLYESGEKADMARKEITYCENAVKAMDTKNEENMTSTYKDLETRTFICIDPRKYLDQISRCLLEYRISSTPDRVDALVGSGNFDGAMQLVKNVQIPEKQRKEQLDRLNRKAREALAAEIMNAKLYTESTSLGSLILGAVIMMVIGVFLTAFFPLAFPIAFVLAVLGLIGNIGELKKREGYKKSYELVEKLKRTGYTL